MTRNLLPYEYELVEALGITEEEYLDFLSIQVAYSDPKEGTIYDTRSILPAAGIAAATALTGAAAAKTAASTLALVSLSLTVVGVLFQVAAALLTPRPSAPGAGRNPREQRFSPRFGFNSGQELAQYGDPINLVYCNTSHNPIGGVRIGTSLVWSSVESYGSTQFMQLLLVLGAASIKTLDFERTAFGQLPLGQFSESNTWLYYEDNGPVNFNDKLLGDGKDPTRDGAASSEDVCRVMFAKSRRDGYSQAFSPSSLTSIGVYDPIPLNIEIQERRNSGKPQWGNLQITIAGGNYGTGGNASYAVGNEITVVFAKAAKRQQIVVKEAAKDMRYQLAESLDRASTYMLGTAKFRLVSVNGGDEVNLDDKDVRAKFECIEAGRRPVTEYDRTRTKIWDEDDREKLQEARDSLNNPLTDAVETSIDRLKQSSPNTYNRLFPTIYVDDYRFTFAAGKTSSNYSKDNTSGQVDEIYGFKFNVNIKVFGFPQNYNFTDDRVVKWTNELDKNQTLTIPSGGSIAVSQKILRSFLANKPKLDVAALRDEIEDDLEKIRQLKDDVDAGAYDRNLRREAKQAISAINKRIDELEDKIDNKVRDASNLNKKTTTISGQKVLKDNTNLDKRNTGIGRLQNEIKRLQDDKQDILSDNVSRLRSRYTKSLRYADSPFTGFDGNRYGSGGIRAMKRRLAQLKGQTTTDQVGVKEVRDKLNELIKEKEDARNDLKLLLKDWEDFIADADDDFFTKCLVKVESAAYQTVTACDFVKFAIRCKLFRRISGRSKDYGESESPDGYRLSDNGIHGRMAFFKVSYKQTGASTYEGFPVVFAVRRGTDQDNFIGLAFKGPSRKKWEFKFDPIGDISAETRSGETHIAFIENEGRVQTFEDGKGATFGWTGALKAIPGAGIHDVLKERGPLYTNEWDLFSNRSDTQVQFSFDGGPEFRITSVTEQQAESIAGKYANLSMMALGVFSGRGVQDLRSITAYVTQGKSSWIVNETTGARTYSADSTSFAPDIFADTTLDTENGIGKFAKSEGIDWNGVALAKRFCKNNGLGCQLFMDGVIAEQTPWRQFWAETAPFSLLEFARVGGRETLIPAVPVNAAGQANREVLVNALFTAGNVLEGSYKEEFIDYGSAVQDLIATVIYRETESQDVFPRNSSVTVSLKGVNPSIAVSQSFDLSQFVTQRAQAILFAKLLCNQRRYIRRGIEFKTFPTDTPISPGAYIYVDIGLNTWERVSSGLIMQGGELNAPLLQGIPNGSYSVLAYQGNTAPVSFASVAVSNGIAASLAPYAGYMFVLGATTNRKRVFRVTEVQMDEEGEVTIKAMEHPCDDVGGKLLSRIANFSNSLFDVR
jgi:transcription elongation GreA/GreB family factor